MAITEKVTVKLIGKDQLSKVFSNTGKKMDVFRDKLNKMGKMATIAAGAFVVGFGVKSVQAAVEFEKSMTNVATLVDTSTESMEDMGDKVKDISKKMPVEIGDLTSALYDVRSAGTSAADAMKVLETSGKLGVAGLGTTKESANLLTTAINAFGLQGEDSSDVADVLFKTVKAGKTDISKLAGAFGKMAGNAKAAKVSFEDTQAATAALTALTGKTSEAQNALAQTFLELTQTGGKLDKGLADNGSSLVELNKKIGEKGLVGGMKEMQEELGLTETEFKNLFSSAEGGTAVYQLLTDAYEGNATALDDMLNGSNKMEEGFKKQTETTAAQYAMFKNNLNVVMTELGTEILPVLIKAMEFVVDGIDAWKWAFESVSPIIKTVVDAWKGGFELMTDAIGGVLYDIGRISDAFGKIKDKGKAAASAVGGFFSGSSRGEKNIPFLPFFQEGGVVPGSPGQAVPIMAHGGETVIPSDKNIGNTFNFNFSGAFIGNVGEFKKEVIDLINKDSELKSLGGV